MCKQIAFPVSIFHREFLNNIKGNVYSSSKALSHKIYIKIQSWGQEQMYTINKHSCKTLFQNDCKNDGKRKILILSVESVQMVQLLEQSHTNHYWRHPCKNQIITKIINIWSNLHSIIPSKDKKHRQCTRNRLACL